MAGSSPTDAVGTSVTTLIKFCNALSPDEQIDYLNALAGAASGMLLSERADKVEGDGDGWEYVAEALGDEAKELEAATEEADNWIARARERWEIQSTACTQVADAENIEIPSITGAICTDQPELSA